MTKNGRLSLSRLGLVVAAGVWGLSCADSPTPPVTTSPDGAVVSGWVYAKDNPYFIERSRTEGRGTPELGGCTFTSIDTLRRGESYVEHMVAYNLQTCEFVRARGEWTAHRPQPAREGMSYKSTPIDRPSESAITADGPSASAKRLDARRSSSVREWNGIPPATSQPSWLTASQWIWWYDPIWIHVAGSKVTVEFYVDQGCVADAVGDHDIEWSSGTGWVLDADNNYEYSGCETWEFRASAFMSNVPFCTGFPFYGSPTYANFWRNSVEPTKDDEIIMVYSTNVTGGCTSLLNFDFERVYPW